jgi:hypothetical protein
MARRSIGALYCPMPKVTVPTLLSLLAMPARFCDSCTHSGTLCQRALPRPTTAMMYTQVLPTRALACVLLLQRHTLLLPSLRKPHNYYARVHKPNPRP